jgi:hypothetical protein
MGGSWLMTSSHDELDEILGDIEIESWPEEGDYYLSSESLDKAKQAIEKWIREGVGEDLPLDQPFDEDMDTITVASNKIFRNGANWARAEIKQRLLGDK